jgi:hypothetical protein
MAKEKNTLVKGHLAKSNLFTVPTPIMKDIEKRGWVHRWLNSTKLNQSGGYDERGYIAYRIPDELRTSLKPGEYGEDYQMSIDGFLRRGDMILGIIPKAKIDVRRAQANQRNKEEQDIRRRVGANHRGVFVEEAESVRGSLQPNINDILDK